jgi:hypothetical protein
MIASWLYYKQLIRKSLFKTFKSFIFVSCNYDSMKKYQFLFLVLLVPVFLNGQTVQEEEQAVKKDRLSLEGSFGVSVPFGDYTKTDPESKNSGFARTGFLGQLTVEWVGKQNMGFGAQYTYQNNPVASSASHDTLVGRTFPLGTGSWSNHYVMIGPVYNGQFGKLSLDVKLMGGIVFAFSPLFSYTSLDSTHKTQTNYGTGFSYQVAAGAGYKVSSRIQVKLNLAYLGAIPTFRKQFGGEFIGFEQVYNESTGTWITNMVYAPVVTLDLKNYINTFNAMIGVVISL